MSSELERLLREGRNALPAPDEIATGRAREKALAALLHRWRTRFRSRIGLAVGLALAIGLGVGVGASIAPSGTAAKGPVGLGFLPEPGWYVLQSGARASSSRPAVAIASNVPFDPDDDIGGLPESSGLPYPTLLALPPHGVVISVTFTPHGEQPWSDASYPVRKLPLRIPEVVQDTRFGAQLRPEEPLGEYQLRAAVNGHNVDVQVYYGTTEPSKAVVAAAQRQLDRLVVGSTRPAARVDERPLPLRPTAITALDADAQSRLVDRTFACSPIAFGGVRDLDIVVGPSRDDAFGRHFVAALEIRTGASESDSSLVLVRARSQQRHPGLALPYAAGGAAGVFTHSRRCALARASLPLSSKGLPGPPIRWFKELDCPVRGRVLVHVRSVLQQPAEWRRIDRTFEGARRPVVETKLAVSLQKTGKPIAYLELDAKGRTALWYSSGCS